MRMIKTEATESKEVTKKPQRNGMTCVLMFLAMEPEPTNPSTPLASKRNLEKGKGLMRLKTENPIFTKPKTNEKKESGTKNRFMRQK